ncbi:MAG: hypothetical protein M3441_03245 [Chloroflexota bacterium]|nr:hypothetical protein [Chloroflexota bacterium]
MGSSEGSKYKIGNVQGVVGDHSHADNSNFVQYAGDVHQLDLVALAPELEDLRQEMLKRATATEQIAAAQQVQTAQVEAQKGNASKVLEALKGAGQWALDVATDIGSKIALEAIKRAMGLP